MSELYVIKGDVTKPVKISVEELSRMTNDALDLNTRIVQQDKYEHVWVSTVFLMSDHYYGPDEVHDPVLWETMVFPHDDWGELACERYTSYEDAVKGHEHYCIRAQNGLYDQEALERQQE